MSPLVHVALGGAVGSCARYLVGNWMRTSFGSSLPWGTLAVNIAGSLAIGVLMALPGRASWFSEEARLLLVVGLLGGFTTYSSFNHETLSLFQSGDWARGAGYIALTLVGCIAAGLGGMALGRVIAGG